MPTTKQRRENARRRLERQIQRRQEAAAARKRRNLVMAAGLGVVVVIAAVVLVVTQVGDNNSTPAAARRPRPQRVDRGGRHLHVHQGRDGDEERGPAAGRQGRDDRHGDPRRRHHPGRHGLRAGPGEGAVHGEQLPYLAGKKYFDNTPCHRLTTGANFGVLQCGDPGGTGSGGPGYSFKDELDKNGKYTKGVLAMANSGPNTNGSQFFIVYKDTQLAPNYTIFGTVTKGLDVVEKVAKGGTQSGQDGKPKTAISLKTITPAQ